MESYKNFIQKHIELTDEDWRLFSSHLKVKYLKKGEGIYFDNNIWDKLYFISSGLVRSYLINDHGQEFTRHFHFNSKESDILNLFIVDYKSFINQVPSSVLFEVLEDSKLYVLDRDIAYKMYSKSAKWERYGRRVAEIAYIRKTEMYEEILLYNTKTRYKNLLSNMQELIHKVPQYHIASFLGISPVTLSRIKKEIS
jgi:CRP-like cAMP-binding protein